jgi:hypothetical protein
MGRQQQDPGMGEQTQDEAQPVNISDVQDELVRVTLYGMQQRVLDAMFVEANQGRSNVYMNASTNAEAGLIAHIINTTLPALVVTSAEPNSYGIIRVCIDWSNACMRALE